MIERVRHPFRGGIADTGVAWCLHAYRNREPLAWCLGPLRQHSPRSRVGVLADGDGVDYTGRAARFRFELVAGEHRFGLADCHRYVLRYLDVLAAGPEAYLLRIDPDTRVWRPFRSLPAFTAVFGTQETLSEGSNDEIDVPANVRGASG